MTFRSYDPDFPGPHDLKRTEALANPYDVEVRDILWLDIPAIVGNLTAAAKRERRTKKAYFGRGITLQVTDTMAQVIMEDPTPEAEAELERSGHSFLIVR